MRHRLSDPDVWDALVTTAFIVAGIATLAFPLLYSRSRWFDSILGRAMMSQSIALTLIVNLSLLFRFWLPPFPWGRAVSGFAITLIAGTSTVLTGILWRLNHEEQWEKFTQFASRHPFLDAFIRHIPHDERWKKESYEFRQRDDGEQPEASVHE